MQPNVANMYELIFYANYPKYNQHQSVSIRKAKQIFLDCLVSFSVIILIGNIYYLWKNQYLSQIKILNQGFRVQFFLFSCGYMYDLLKYLIYPLFGRHHVHRK